MHICIICTVLYIHTYMYIYQCRYIHIYIYNKTDIHIHIYMYIYLGNATRSGNSGNRTQPVSLNSRLFNYILVLVYILRVLCSKYRG